MSLESPLSLISFGVNSSEFGANASEQCATQEQSRLSSIKFYFIGVFGFSICVLGVIMNTILLKILLKPYLRSTYFVYLAALAVLDIAVAVTYVMVMSVYQIHEYAGNWFLYHLWHLCLPYFFTLSRVVTLASTYMVVVCTAERFLEVLQLAKDPGKSYKINKKTRYVVIASVIASSAAFRFVVFWEVKVETNELCRDTGAYYELTRTWLVKNFYYSKIYAFYILHVVQVFFPFAALLSLNATIIRNWRIALRRSNTRASDEELAKRVQSARSARKMMAAIVASYLVCNLLNLVLTFFEHIDHDFLERHDVFYTLASDAVTMLTVVNASFRLPIYYASNLRIRNELRRLFGQKLKRRRKKSRSSRVDSANDVEAVSGVSEDRDFINSKL